jgi:hypothetical protein
MFCQEIKLLVNISFLLGSAGKLSRDDGDRSKQFLLSYFRRGVCQLLYITYWKRCLINYEILRMTFQLELRNTVLD